MTYRLCIPILPNGQVTSTFARYKWRGYFSIIGLWAVLIGLFVSVVSETNGQSVSGETNCLPPDHSIWSELLQAHVNNEGWVSYQGFIEDSIKLDQYLATLSKCTPTSLWGDDEKLAFWINAYNAFTVKLITKNWPLNSIKDVKKGIPFINSVWDIVFIDIGQEKFSLNDIEHSILRKQLTEPRIHFAIVCASRSCPKLLNEAFLPSKLEDQLNDQARGFINDKSKNIIENDQLRLSQIFRWFSADFTKEQSLKAFIRKYSENDFSPDCKVTFLEYDWSLNGN